MSMGCAKRWSFGWCALISIKPSPDFKKTLERLETYLQGWSGPALEHGLRQSAKPLKRTQQRMFPHRYGLLRRSINVARMKNKDFQQRGLAGASIQTKRSQVALLVGPNGGNKAFMNAYKGDWLDRGVQAHAVRRARSKIKMDMNAARSRRDGRQRKPLMERAWMHPGVKPRKIFENSYKASVPAMKSEFERGVNNWMRRRGLGE